MLMRLRLRGFLRPCHGLHGKTNRYNTLRHDFLASAVRRIVSRASCPSSMEPSYRHLRPARSSGVSEGLRRGDVLAVLPDGRIVIIDVVVRHSAAPSYAREASRYDGAAARHAERLKRREFAHFADGAQYDFVPFAVESYGRLGPAAMGFLSALGDVAASGGHISKSAFVAGALKELSCALQRGNGRMYGHSLFRIARASGRQFRPGCEVPVEAAVEV